MAQLRIYLDINLYDSLKEGNITLEQFLNEVTNDGGNPTDEYDDGSKGEIIAQLLSYHSHEGGSPVCDEFVITDEKFDDDKRGSFEINYNVAYHFSCAGMDSDEDHHENVKFEIDIDDEVFVLNFMDKEPRTTREEF